MNHFKKERMQNFAGIMLLSHIVKRSIQHIAGSNFVSIHPRSSQETGDICAFQAFHNKYTVLPMALVDSTGPHRDW